MRVRKFYVAAVIAGAMFGIGLGSAANASSSGEYAARAANHLTPVAKYDGSYDRVSSTVVCYGGRVSHPISVRQIMAKHRVQYCTDGWVSIQIKGSRWIDRAPSPCRTESSTRCYWDARTQGNGRGHSFYATAHCVFYTDKAYAEAQNYCTSWT